MSSYPLIIQGGMGIGVSLSNLASSVRKEGCFYGWPAGGGVWHSN